MHEERVETSRQTSQIQGASEEPTGRCLRASVGVERVRDGSCSVMKPGICEKTVDDKTVDIKRVKTTVQNLPVGHVVVTIYRNAD